MRAIVLAACLCMSPALAAAETIPIPGHPPVLVHGPVSTARELIATELAFAKRSAEAGPGPAMRAFMDPVNGLSFAGGDPARGAEAIYRAHGGANGGTLSWYPAEVFAASGGDMGTVWGYFRFVPPGKPGPVVTGRYVTVWQKEGGVWKGIIDTGNPD